MTEPSGGRAAREGTPHSIDELVERAGRWTAGRTTRRSFLGQLGRLGVLVAGGAGMATLLADVAYARVCGQSGVAPKCDTFTCNETWGWCWYASGCCADGALKKICDCCAPNTPNPVGYCPSGTQVLCIVESCGADPRLQTKPTVVLDETDPTRLTVAVSRRVYPDGAALAVIGDAESALFGAVAASAARLADGPVLLTPRAGLHGAVAEELGRLRVEFVKVIGSTLSPAVDAELAARGIHVERVGNSTDAGDFSAEVAAWSRGLTGGRTGVVVMPGAAQRVVGPAAALANALRLPLLLGDSAAVREALASPRPVRRTYVVTDDPAAADSWPGGTPVTGGDPVELSVAIADVVVGLRGGVPSPMTLAQPETDRAAVAMATVPGPLLLHPPGQLGPVFDWVLRHRAALDGALVSGGGDAFGSPPTYDLQAVLNEFETHLLSGQAGEGLPVIPQPREERPIGKARR
ncbi:MAG: hypothetical protein H0V93_00480 [Euzebyales bacterium]|nr:hypothetical protein [Euzebyales bacterium]